MTKALGKSFNKEIEDALRLLKEYDSLVEHDDF